MSDVYDPRVKKTRSKPYDRKTMLDIGATHMPNTSSTEATAASSLPGYGAHTSKKSCLLNQDDCLSGNPQTIAEYRQQKKAEENQLVKVKPYIKKDNLYFKDYAKTVTSINVRSNALSVSGNRIQQELQEDKMHLSAIKSNPNDSLLSSTDVSDRIPINHGRKDCDLVSKPVYVHGRSKVKTGKVKTGKSPGPVMYGPIVNEEKIRQNEKYLHAIGLVLSRI